MNCLKCGRDIEESQVFCPECLEDMKKYPVKPNIAIQLPHREEHTFLKKPQIKRRQAPTPEEKLRSMRRYLLRMLILWFATLALLVASLYPALQYFLGRSFRMPGQNYSTFSTEPTETTTPAATTVPPTTP